MATKAPSAPVVFTFAPYDPEEAKKRITATPSACAFTMLVSAMNSAPDKPKDPGKWNSWKKYGRIMDALDGISETVPITVRMKDGTTEEGYRTVLNPEGGSFTLSPADAEEFRTIFEKHAEKLPIGAAREVNCTFLWWDENVREITAAPAGAAGAEVSGAPASE